MRGMLWFFVVLAAGAGALAFWRFYETEFRPADTGPPIIVGTAADEKHKVTPEMKARTAAKEGKPAPAFEAEASNGKAYRMDDLAAKGPVLLVFIKDGCPCSTAAEPFFRKLHESYGDKAQFLGVIDGNLQVATAWANRHLTPYPILLDPALQIVHDYDVSNSAHVALINKGGTLTAFWPGFSDSMLREVGRRLAQECATEEINIDTSDAPAELYSGCPFETESAPTSSGASTGS